MNRQMVNVYLGGELGQLFKPSWRLSVASPAEAIRAIDINTKGKLRRYLQTDGYAKYYRISLQEETKDIWPQEIMNPSGNCDIYILPVIGGANSGVGKIIVGALLITAAIVLAATGNIPTAGVVFNIAFSLGTSLILGGIAQLLAPHQQQNGELGSAVFQGTVNAGAQGGSLPVVYGKALVAPLPISIWFNNVDYLTTQNQFAGIATVTDLPGGGYQVSVPIDISNSVTSVS